MKRQRVKVSLGPLLGEQNIQAKELHSLSGLDDRLKSFVQSTLC